MSEWIHTGESEFFIKYIDEKGYLRTALRPEYIVKQQITNATGFTYKWRVDPPESIQVEPKPRVPNFRLPIPPPYYPEASSYPRTILAEAIDGVFTIDRETSIESTGELFPGVVEGAEQNENAKHRNGEFSIITPDHPELKASGFDISIPRGANVLGVKVRVRRRSIHPAEAEAASRAFTVIATDNNGETYTSPWDVYTDGSPVTFDWRGNGIKKSLIFRDLAYETRITSISLAGSGRNMISTCTLLNPYESMMYWDGSGWHIFANSPDANGNALKMYDPSADEEEDYAHITLEFEITGPIQSPGGEE